MNIGFIAHESKKKLLQNFVLHTEESSASISSMRPEHPGV